jgi:phosphoribosylformimino-5-aminoimidazole carboxamide ribotide isomerase
MLVIPAIDIKGGMVVRLLQGRYQEETIYSHDPVSVAKDWQDKGAALIHIVDLDGALTGELKNMEIASKIAKEISIPVELGGGIRTRSDINLALQSGISRVVLGTMACNDEQFIKEMVFEFGERVIVSIDVKGEKVVTKGWTVREEFSPTELARRMERVNVRGIIYTDISRDGTLRGPDVDGITQMLAAVNVPLIASGGISSLRDIRSLKELEKEGLIGVIVGKALYEAKLDLAQAVELAR